MLFPSKWKIKICIWKGRLCFSIEYIYILKAFTFYLLSFSFSMDPQPLDLHLCMILYSLFKSLPSFKHLKKKKKKWIKIKILTTSMKTNRLRGVKIGVVFLWVERLQHGPTVKDTRSMLMSTLQEKLQSDHSFWHHCHSDS